MQSIDLLLICMLVLAVITIFMITLLNKKIK